MTTKVLFGAYEKHDMRIVKAFKCLRYKKDTWHKCSDVERDTSHIYLFMCKKLGCGGVAFEFDKSGKKCVCERCGEGDEFEFVKGEK